MIHQNSKEELIELVYQHRAQLNKMQNVIDEQQRRLDDAKDIAVELEETNQFRIIKRLALSKKLAASLNIKDETV